MSVILVNKYNGKCWKYTLFTFLVWLFTPNDEWFPSQCPSGTILLTPYSMVWDWRVSSQCFLIGLSFSIPTIVLCYFSISLLSVYRLVLWGWGLRTDRVYITLSQPCTNNNNNDAIIIIIMHLQCINDTHVMHQWHSYWCTYLLMHRMMHLSMNEPNDAPIY